MIIKVKEIYKKLDLLLKKSVSPSGKLKKKSFAKKFSVFYSRLVDQQKESYRLSYTDKYECVSNIGRDYAAVCAFLEEKISMEYPEVPKTEVIRLLYLAAFPISAKMRNLFEVELRRCIYEMTCTLEDDYVKSDLKKIGLLDVYRKYL
jgi:hypothetical protein